MHQYGDIAQLGERMTGSHEVRGSNPLISTIKTAGQSLIDSGLFQFRKARTPRFPHIF